MRLLSVLLLPLTLAAGCAARPPAASAATASPAGSWERAAPMRHARSAHAVVGDAQHLYALAGSGAGGRPVLEVERFDGQAWQPETTLPAGASTHPRRCSTKATSTWWAASVT